MKRHGLNRDEAENIAIGALSFLAGDPVLLRRFLDLSGIEADAIRAAAREPGFLAGVLRFIVQHEPTLMRFCEENGVRGRHVMDALRALPLGDDDSIRPEQA
jgi:hypothetical protein